LKYCGETEGKRPTKTPSCVSAGAARQGQNVGRGELEARNDSQPDINGEMIGNWGQGAGRSVVLVGMLKRNSDPDRMWCTQAPAMFRPITVRDKFISTSPCSTVAAYLSFLPPLMQPTSLFCLSINSLRSPQHTSTEGLLEILSGFSFLPQSCQGEAAWPLHQTRKSLLPNFAT
jgi:hypothetical protein